LSEASLIIFVPVADAAELLVAGAGKYFSKSC
jgi:hypothetical protein